MLANPWITGAGVEQLDIGSDLCNDAQLDLAATLASSILYELTGHRWNGLATQVVRPCARRHDGGGPAWPSTVTPPWNVYTAPPWLGAWLWNSSWGRCTCDLADQGCQGCQRLSRIGLGAYPIQTVDEVLLNGAVLVEGTDYRLVDKQLLERAPGHWWPFCQDLFSAATEDHTFQVTYTWGQAPPDAGVTVAGLYALEIGKALCGQECNLPSRVASVLRQGTTVTFTDPSQLVQNGLTGVPLVDTWVGAVNGGRRPTRPASIASPDRPQTIEYVWPT